MLSIVAYWRACCYLEGDSYRDGYGEAERGVELAERTGSDLAESLNLRLLSAARGLLGEHGLAITAAQEAVGVATGLGEPYKLAAMHDLAWALVRAGRNREAVEVSRERVTLSRQLGDVRGEALSMAILGDALLGLGDLNVAVGCLNFALSLFREHHAHRLEAVCLQRLGYVYESMACYPEAVSYLEESMRIFRELQMAGRVTVVNEALDRCRVQVGGPRR